MQNLWERLMMPFSIKVLQIATTGRLKTNTRARPQPIRPAALFSSLNRGAAQPEVYVGFCVLKTIAQIVFAVYFFWLWHILFAFLQAGLGGAQFKWVRLPRVELRIGCFSVRPLLLHSSMFNHGFGIPAKPSMDQIRAMSRFDCRTGHSTPIWRGQK